MRILLLAVALCACGDDTPASVDAPVADAPAADAPPDAPPALCDRPGVLFCEDFESLALGPATSPAWTTEAAAGALTIDATHARGQRALKIATAGNGRGRLQATGLALPANSAWGTMHAWVSAFPTAPTYAHYTLVELAGTGNSTLLRPIGGQYIPASGSDPAGSFWGVGSDGGPTGDWTNWRRTAPSLGGAWHCLEFQLDGATDSIHVWLDGVAHPELSVSRTEHGGADVDFVFPALDRVWFGWWLYQANPTPAAYDVWLDDLALGSERLGCD